VSWKTTSWSIEMASPTLQKGEYERRKLFLEELKTLSKEQYEDIFRIIKRNNVEYSENSNGIFFDVLLLPDDIFKQLEQFIEFSRVQTKSEEDRTHELDVLRSEAVQKK
jgi:hypothetical protein